MAKYRCSVCGYIYDEEKEGCAVFHAFRVSGLSSAGQCLSAV